VSAADFMRQILFAFRREGWMVALVVVAIGFGIGTTVAMVAVVRALSADPVPHISAQLHVPYFDASKPGFAVATQTRPGDAFTYVDVRRLLASGRARQQAATAAGRMLIRPDAPGLRPFHANGRLVTPQFFAMLEVPFGAGAPWTADEDAQAAAVVVLNGGLARKLFGDDAPVGESVRMGDRDFRVVGVLDDWHPRPLFYAGIRGDAAFVAEDAWFVPLSTALRMDTGFAGGMSCWGEDTRRIGDGCAWLQYWVRLPTRDDARRYRAFLDADWNDQRARGRHVPPGSPQLLDFTERMRRLQLVSSDIALQTWLAFGLLGVCIANASALMLATTLRRTREICIRRAIGASVPDIWRQLCTEAIGIGLACSVVGALVAWLAIRSLRHRSAGWVDLVQFDGALISGLIVASLASALLATAAPLLRATRVAPALQLRMQ
jgi:putative ABC transport system permease protein